MPLYVCLRKGVKYNHKMLNFGEEVEASLNPDPRFFAEKSTSTDAHIAKSKKSNITAEKLNEKKGKKRGNK